LAQLEVASIGLVAQIARMFRGIIAAALVVASTAAEPAIAERASVQTETYSLRLSDDWAEAPSTDAEQRTFVSRSRDVRLVVSSMQAAIPADRFEEIARFVIGRRLELEHQFAAARGQSAMINGPVVISESWGTSMSYTGSYSGGRQFSYSGSVTGTQVLNLYLESETLSHQQLIDLSAEVASGLDFTF
jgi:hypothetical protein